ncbi:hypothetical protein SAMN04487936_102236 [Halobacillus dabanensis]|uniref:DUF8042 domain-containing protein n=1 Tax=Halobacillus dabanensis TaxID=240302 RepID=A0A1I3RGM8_HALDA|nr:hypothetical protein [Halobacillus dabanensis]SFJ45428.1 hypothetical protein SAMN04487936_102236 [Halobacillus dabanensis]
MSKLTTEQHHMLEQYDQLLNTISEGLEYLENNITEEAAPQTQQVFQDVLLGLEQVSRSHDQMAVLFEAQEEVQPLIVDFHGVVQLLQGWFELETNEEKRRLLVEQVVPAYETWRTSMQSFVKPYIAH